jgi:hypothetical protein
MGESERERALHILKELTPNWSKTNSKRTKTLLTSPELFAPSHRYPDPWCNAWAFVPGAYHGEALDVALTPRKERLQTSLVWTQGSRFYFSVGYMIYERNNLAVQVHEARPAEPAKVEALNLWTPGISPSADEVNLLINEFRDNGSDAYIVTKKSKNITTWTLCRMVRRDSGFVRAAIYARTQGPFQWKLMDTFVTSQDVFIKMLIAGRNT